MSQSQLSELEQKHRIPEKDIAKALRHNSIDHLAIADLKKQKLWVKEQIEHIRETGLPAPNFDNATALN